MKFTRSLRLYFLTSMLIIGSLSIFAMSIVAITYFFAGLDLAMIGSMYNQASGTEILDGQPKSNGNLTIASRFQDLPEPIKNTFKEQDIKLNQLSKYVKHIPLFTKPKTGYFAIKFNIKGKNRYVSVILHELSLTNLAKEKNLKSLQTPHFSYILLTTLIVILLFYLTMLVIFRTVSAPIKDLRTWAKSLDKEKLKQPIPDFNYIELNSLAKIVQSSLNSVQNSLKREQRFLGYASHELRTPIAVTRANSELLRKLIEINADKAKQEEVLNRIERALFTMTDLTETLLWLNRQESKSLPLKKRNIGLLIEQISNELFYLLNGKEVNVNISKDNTCLILPQALIRIIITNLIRNAFQHTQNGIVNITQIEKELTIENINIVQKEYLEELGFGLGLELTERLIVQYGWYYENIETATGRKVKIVFD